MSRSRRITTNDVLRVMLLQAQGALVAATNEKLPVKVLLQLGNAKSMIDAAITLITPREP